MDSDDEAQYGAYMAVPTFDIDDAMADNNKHEHLPWEDQMWVVGNGAWIFKGLWGFADL